MAGVSISPEENQLLSTLPQCCVCNKLIYQAETWILLTCTHFLYCEECFVTVLQRDDVVTCNLCGSQWSDLDRDETLKAIGEDIRELYSQEVDSSTRISALKQTQTRIQHVYDLYQNPPDSRQSEEQPVETGVKVKDVSGMPLVGLPEVRQSGDYQCEYCGKTVSEGKFRCECGHVDFGAYMKWGMKEEKEEEKGEIVPEPPVDPAVNRSHSSNPRQSPDEPIDALPPPAKQSTSYVKLSEGAESIASTQHIVVPSKPPLRARRPGEVEEEDDSGLRACAKVLIVFVIIILLYDIIQVNSDS